MTNNVNDIPGQRLSFQPLRDVEGRTSFSHPYAAQPAGENRSVASLSCALRYRAWYDSLMQKARNRSIDSPYTEIHHVLPRSMGGSDELSNLVELTYREHFIAHWLLTKFLNGPNLRKCPQMLSMVLISAPKSA